MNDIIPLKRCPKCDNDFPPTLQYFYNDKSKKDGLTCYCKLCQSAKGSKKPSRKPKTDIKRHRSTSQEYKYCPKCQQEKPATLEYFYSHKGYGRYGLCSECKDCRALYRKAHFEELRTYHRQQELKNLDRNQARRKAYRESHAEENRRRTSEYERPHTEKKASEFSRTSSNNRRARKKAARGSFTVADVRSQYQRQKGKCYWCHEKLAKWHVDHIVTLARDGSNGPENLVITC